MINIVLLNISTKFASDAVRKEESKTAVVFGNKEATRRTARRSFAVPSVKTVDRVYCGVEERFSLKGSYPLDAGSIPAPATKTA